MEIKLSKGEEDKQKITFTTGESNYTFDINTSDCRTLRDLLDALLVSPNNQEYKKECIKNKLNQLSTIDTRGMQNLAIKVDSESMENLLLICHHFKHSNLSDKLYGSISLRAAEMLRDDIGIKISSPIQIKNAVVVVDLFLDIAKKLEEFGLLCFKQNEDDWIG